MFHPYNKNSSYLRKAIYKAYNRKCFYCGEPIQYRQMQIDHIVPSNMEQKVNDDVQEYLFELTRAGFIVDSIENYLPACAACNNKKRNLAFHASNLRFYHEMAGKHVDEILKTIDEEKLKGQESFYEPIDEQVWIEVDFSFQRSISHAIMGYRLTAKDVRTCPKFPPVNRIVKQLKIVDYVMLQGEMGCGKSISIYQAAYEFFQKGWRVYEYKATDDLSIPYIPQNTEPSLYIIDDVQRFSDKAIDGLIGRALPNTKVLLAKTISTTMHQESILLASKDAVKTLYEDFLSRKEEIVSIVHQCDKHVGVNSFDLPIERRLTEASKARTPWQFNYILRGGWQTIKEQYQAVQAHHNCDILLAAIALFQVVQLDSSVNFSWLCDYLKRFDNAFSWNDDDLQYLIDRRLVLSKDDVRIIHVESAVIIIVQFIQDVSDRKSQTLFAALEVAFIEKKVSPMGLVWLCNGLLSHMYKPHFIEMFISQKMISFIFEDLENIQTSQERTGIAYFMEKVFSTQYEKNGYWYFQQSEALMLEWITHADSTTAYAYSNLINTLYNTDNKQHKQFVKKIDWAQIARSILAEESPNLYAWGDLLNRLTSFLSSRDRKQVAAVIRPVVDSICSKASITNIAGISDFFSFIVHLDPTYIHNSIDQLFPIYRDLFYKDAKQVLRIIDFDFLMKICGVNPLFKHRATKAERKTCLMLVDALSALEFARVISNSLPREWRSIYSIMRLTTQYDKKKAGQIISLVDTNELANAAEKSWDTIEEITYLCSLLCLGNEKIARCFIESNKEKIRIMSSSLTVIAPQCAIELYRTGVSIDLVTEHWWDTSYFAMLRLIKVNKATAGDILRSNISGIVEKVNRITMLDFDDKYFLEFLQLLGDFDIDVYKEILAAVNVKAIDKRMSDVDQNQGNDLKSRERYQQFIGLLESWRI